jgi:hypothetical protein
VFCTYRTCSDQCVEVTEALQWIALSRPDVVLQTKSTKPESISRGLLPSGSAMVVFQAKAWRTEWARVHDRTISNSDVEFLDVGSGDGSVLLTVSVVTAGPDGPWRVAGIEHTPGVHATSIEWLTRVGRECPMMSDAVADIQRNIFCRDATSSADPHVVRSFGEADVIFINNLCFGATLQTGGRTINMQLTDSMMKFCTVKATPTLIITTAALTGVNDRTLMVLHGNLLAQVGSFEIDRSGYNWGREGVPLTLYMHTITRGPSPGQ